MTDYTPTTDDVRSWYARDDDASPATSRRLRAQFDRWLAAHEREVAAIAWDEGHEASERAWVHALDGHPVAEGEMCDECEVRNPYREGGADRG